jgi:predicted nucleotidyltransferase
MPTALELKREGWTPYLDAASRRSSDTALTPEEEQERERLLARVRKAAEILKRRFAVRHVILFGSLAHTSWFMPDSDVDLAVAGLAATDFWSAWKVVEEVIEDRPVDLIEIDEAGDGLRGAIERHGIEL